VIQEASSTSAELGRARLASIVFLGVLPVLALGVLFASTVQDDAVAFDFRPFYRAAGAVLHGVSPYPSPSDPLTAESGAYVYPPPAAVLALPLRVLPEEAAGLVMMALLAIAALGTLFILGVRDWRCYGVLLLWPPVLSAIQTGNLTLLLGLCAALAWRYRDRALIGAAAVGVTLAAKFFLWPLVVWLAATRRFAGGVLACVIGVGLLFGSWALVSFAGLAGYPELMRRLNDSIGLDSYTVYIVGLDLGLPSIAARAVWLIVGLGLLTCVVVTARRGEERTAFILALAAALAITPIVWLHYFALLSVAVAVAQPRLGLVWFVPLAMVVTPGSGHPTPFQTTATLAIAGLTIALALRESRSASYAAGTAPALVVPVGSS
jgi:alpha-1,2-mannosyltransferase